MPLPPRTTRTAADIIALADKTARQNELAADVAALTNAQADGPARAATAQWIYAGTTHEGELNVWLGFDDTAFIAAVKAKGPAQGASADGILTSAALDLAEKSLVYFAEKDPQNQLIAYGCGFLVNDSNTAVSAAHNFEDPQNPGHSLVKQKAVVEAYFGRPFDGETIQLELKSIDFRLDLAVFSIQGRSAGAPTAFLPLVRAPRLGIHCVLVAFQLGLRAEIVDLDPDYGVGVMAGNVVRVHPQHISYSCPSFSGDSGGAVVLGDGGIFAIHLFTANQWRERQNTTAVSDDAHLEDMAESVDSLIRGGGSVSIGLKLMGNI